MPNCHLCETEFETYLDFGRMPIANGFLTEEEFDDEYFYNLAIGQCPKCLMVQLVDFVPPEKLFHDKYPFHTSSSVKMQEHFEHWAWDIQGQLAHYDNPLVVEIGCNDGTMLRHFLRNRHIGVEPAMNMAELARQKGCRVYPSFFDEDAAEFIRSMDGRAQVIYGANVFPHIPDLHSVLRGIDLLLEPDGQVIIEEPYWPTVVSRNAFDQIYDEHYYYFTLHALERLFGHYGFECVKHRVQPTHGGSMRYTFMRNGKGIQFGGWSYRKWEAENPAVMDLQSYPDFRDRIERTAFDLGVTLCWDPKAVGYAATSKSTTVIHYCGLDPEDNISCIYDTTPNKIGKYSPGVHIPIRDYKHFKEDNPEYAVLFAWNHRREIVAKEMDWLKKGGKFIEYVPGGRLSDYSSIQSES